MPLQFIENRTPGARLNFNSNPRARMASVVSVSAANVTSVPGTNITATDVQGALDQIDPLLTAGGGTASGTTYTPTGNIAATNVQDAIDELDTEKQPVDATLTALAAYNTNGLITQTAANTFTGRTVTGPAAGISVSNGDGVSGNPTLALANDLSALEGLASTGIAVRSASDTWVQRSVAGTANEITATNGDGVSGNPTLSLPSTLTLTGKTVTVDTQTALDNSTKPATTAYVYAATRDKLTANRTYYVRADGSNSNTGLVDSAGGAWLTIQYAIDFVWDKLDLAGYTCTIRVKDGTYTGAVSRYGAPVGGTPVLEGNTTTPANVVISVTSNNAFDLRRGASLEVKGLKVQTTTAGHGFHISSQSRLLITGNMDFGAIASGYYHITADSLSKIIASSSYTISGSANSHWHASNGSSITQTQGSPTITLSGTPAFSVGYVSLDQGSIAELNATYSGSATGPLYNISDNSVLDRFATTLPGNGAKTCTDGAIDKDASSGTWTPAVTFATPGDLAVAYTTQLGYYNRHGNVVTYWFQILTSSFTHTTASGQLRISGLPFTNQASPAISWAGTAMLGGYTKANYTWVAVGAIASTSTFGFIAGGSGQAPGNVSATDMPTGGTLFIRGSVVCPVD